MRKNKISQEDKWTLKAMEKHGNEFTKSLAVALRLADPYNFKVIKEAAAEIWAQFRAIGIDSYGHQK